MSQQQTDVNTDNSVPPEAGEEPGSTPAPAGDPVAELEALVRDVEQWKHKADENLDLAMRARAELDNVRKRTARDVENAHKYALESFVKDLLPVLDSLELAIAASQSAGDMASHRLGLDLTLKMFIDTLQKFGVAALDPLGEKFNPEKHQAVSAQDAAGVEPGTVVAVMQKGYELNGRLVRPAMVAVAR